MVDDSGSIDAKTAASIARQYLVDLLGTQPDLRLEEVELVETEGYWLVTLSYSTGVLQSLREYKIFKIQASDGRVMYMKIRGLD